MPLRRCRELHAAGQFEQGVAPRRGRRTPAATVQRPAAGGIDRTGSADWPAVDAPLNSARPHRRIIVSFFDNKRNASWLLIVVSLGTILYGIYVVLRRHE